MNRVLAVLSLAALTALASAQHVEVAANITSVQTAGRWVGQGASGTYRVIVVQDGWEHVWSRVYVEWLPDPKGPEAERSKPVAVEELRIPGVSQGTSVLEAKASAVGTAGLSVTVTVRSNSEPKAKPGRFVFRLREPGKVTLNQPAPAR